MAKGIYIGVDNIARKVKKMYIGKNEELEVLDYIESTGTQYIDTGIVPKSTTRVVIDYAYSSIPTATEMMGWGGSGGTEAFAWGWRAADGLFSTVSSNYTQISANVPTDTNRHVFDLKSGSQKLDGVEYATDTIGNTATTGQTMYLFGLHGEWNTSTAVSLCNAKIYSCKIYDNEFLVRDYIPTKDTKGIYCLYDIISNTYFYNKGTGEFIGGKPTEEKLNLGDKARKVIKGYIGVKETYKVLDYIESTGTQYIDTEITASQDIKVEMNFENLETSKSTHMVGSRITAGEDSINIAYMNESWGKGYSFAWGDETQQTTDTTTSNRSYILGNNKAYINDTLIHTFTAQTFTNFYNMFLFTCNNGGVPHTQYSSIRLRYCKIWDNNILVRDLIPVKRQNGEYCLYDKVSGKMFYNKGSGSFIAGNETGEEFSQSVARKFYASDKKLSYLGLIDNFAIDTWNIGSAVIGDYAIFAKYDSIRAYNSKLIATTPASLSTSRQSDSKWANSNSNYALFCGGSNGSTRYNTVDAYNSNLSRSTASGLSDYSKYRVTTVPIGVYLLVAGGARGSNSISVSGVNSYDTNLVRGTAPALYTASQLLASASNSKYALVAGGIISSGDPTNIVNTYTANLTKSTTTGLSQARARLTGCRLGDYVVFAGGQSTNSDTASKVIDIYDNNNVKITAPNLTYGRIFASSASNEDIMLITGGYGHNQTSWHGTTEVLTKDLVKYMGTSTACRTGDNFIQNLDKYFIIAGGETDAYVYDYE